MPRYIPGAACWWPMAPKPPVHRRSCVRCTSRRWRLLVYTEQGRTAPVEPPPGGRTAAVGSTTTSHRLVVSKCAFSRGPTKRTERPGHPRTLPPFGSLLLVDHRLSSLCHSATNEPSANVYLGGETTLYILHLNCLLETNHPGSNLIRR